MTKENKEMTDCKELPPIKQVTVKEMNGINTVIYERDLNALCDICLRPFSEHKKASSRAHA